MFLDLPRIFFTFFQFPLWLSGGLKLEVTSFPLTSTVQIRRLKEITISFSRSRLLKCFMVTPFPRLTGLWPGGMDQNWIRFDLPSMSARRGMNLGPTTSALLLVVTNASYLTNDGLSERPSLNLKCTESERPFFICNPAISLSRTSALVVTTRRAARTDHIIEWKYWKFIW